MLRRLLLRDVVIVAELEVDLAAGFTVLTGETGAGKSILIDALQLALGNRADAALVREGAARAEVSAEFDTPPALRPWLEDAGFALDDTLLLRRSVDVHGKSRAWVNGSPATVAQLRQAAEELVDIHGQHAWQSLTRPAAVRSLLDGFAALDTTALAALWQAWRQAAAALADAQNKRATLQLERERLAWQLAELDKLAPAPAEWEALNAEHQKLAHGQALLDAARGALAALAGDSEEDSSNTSRAGRPSRSSGAGQATAAGTNASTLTARAIHSLLEVQGFDPALGAVLDVLHAAQAQLDDAAHTLSGYLNHNDPDPQRLAAVDTRLGAWVSLARRYRRAPADLPDLVASWKAELKGLDAATDLDSLEQTVTHTLAAWRTEAARASRARGKAAPQLGAAVTQAMQQLGMAGGSFEVALLPQDEPQAYGQESVEFRVAGHAGSTPRALGKVASGGELSRLALAIAVTTAQQAQPITEGSKDSKDSKAGAEAYVPTLIFDEIDAGVGGTVADSVGRLMKQLGHSSQVLAVTHLAQVAACADGHFVVSKALQGKQTLSAVNAVQGVARVAEIARMLGGEKLSGTAQANTPTTTPPTAPTAPTAPNKRKARST
jgi:DNA repair protein RecN (Recombination protein N)